MKGMRKKLVKLLTVATLGLLVPVCAFALRIDNPHVRLKQDPKEKQSITINVDNPTANPVSVKVYLEDFTYTEPYDGDKNFFARGTSPNTLSDCVTFAPTQLTLDPFASRPVSITISPDRAFKQTRYGVLFFETVVGHTTKDGEGIDVLGRLGSLLFVDPVDGKKQADLSAVSGSQRKIKATLANVGNMFFASTGTFYVMNAAGMVSDRGTITEAYLPPAAKKEVLFALAPTVAPGDYTAVLNFDLEDSDVFVKEVDFSLSASGEIKISGTRD